METDWKGATEGVLNAARLAGLDLSKLLLSLVNSRLDAEGLRNRVWTVAPYRCDRCGHIEWYEVEVGVEGPPSWREDSTFVASPFVAGLCPRDGQTMTHVMHYDLTLPELVAPGTPFVSPFLATETYASRMFRVPRKPVQYVTHGCDDNGDVIYSEATHAFLATPMHAIRRATSGAAT